MQTTVAELRKRLRCEYEAFPEFSPFAESVGGIHDNVLRPGVPFLIGWRPILGVSLWGLKDDETVHVDLVNEEIGFAAMWVCYFYPSPGEPLDGVYVNIPSLKGGKIPDNQSPLSMEEINKEEFPGARPSEFEKLVEDGYREIMRIVEVETRAKSTVL